MSNGLSGSTIRRRLLLSCGRARVLKRFEWLFTSVLIQRVPLAAAAPFPGSSVYFAVGAVMNFFLGMFSRL